MRREVYQNDQLIHVEFIPDTPEQVDEERDRRVAAGFVFNGVLFQSRPQDRENIAGAAQLALFAKLNGAQPGDFRWHGGTSDYVWIAADNSLHLMDAATMIGFAQAAAAHHRAHIFAARAIKDDPDNLDCTDDALWP
jgi:hypothetical protein